MNLIPILPEHLIEKYSLSEYPLCYEYIGPERTHGDDYFKTNYHWYECIDDTETGSLSPNQGQSFGLVCLTEQAWLPLSLHISVLEVLKKGEGWGSKIMRFIINFAKSKRYKSITLQPHDDNLVKFYSKFGFLIRYYFDIKIMRLYL